MALGSISYAVSSLFPTDPCDGGIVASFQFQVSPTAVEGSTQVQFDNVILANSDGLEIQPQLLIKILRSLCWSNIGCTYRLFYANLLSR